MGTALPNETDLDFSQLSLIPGATVAINPRLDKKGYFIVIITFINEIPKILADTDLKHIFLWRY